MPRTILDDRDLHKFATREYVLEELGKNSVKMEEQIARSIENATPGIIEAVKKALPMWTGGDY